MGDETVHSSDGSEQLVSQLAVGDEIPIPGRKNEVQVTEINKLGKNLVHIFVESSRGGEYRVSADTEIGYVETRRRQNTSRRVGSPVDIGEWFRSLQPDDEHAGGDDEC